MKLGGAGFILVTHGDCVAGAVGGGGEWIWGLGVSGLVIGVYCYRAGWGGGLRIEIRP